MKRTWIIAIPLLVVLVLLIGMGAGACGDGNGEETAPTPGAEEEAALTPYPWTSIFIKEHLPRKGNVLEVIVDFSRQLSSDEIESLKEKIKLIDEDGREYHPSSHSTTGGTIKHGPDITWHADLAYSFLFEVESESSSYTLSWPDYPPLVVGNPFKSPFLLESGAPSATTTTPTPTPTPAEEEEEVTPPEEEEESTSPILTDGTHRWRLQATTFGDKKFKALSKEFETSEGWVVLQAEFEDLSGRMLIRAWYRETKGEETSMIETFLRGGIANVYVIDSQGSMYPAVVLSRSQITFVVPYDGHGFTLHFLDWAPIELGY